MRLIIILCVCCVCSGYLRGCGAESTSATPPRLPPHFVYLHIWRKAENQQARMRSCRSHCRGKPGVEKRGMKGKVMRE